MACPPLSISCGSPQCLCLSVYLAFSQSLGPFFGLCPPLRGEHSPACDCGPIAWQSFFFLFVSSCISIIAIFLRYIHSCFSPLVLRCEKPSPLITMTNSASDKNTQFSEADLRARFAAAGQTHVFQHADSLSPAERDQFLDSLCSMDLDEIQRLFLQSRETAGKLDFDRMRPWPAARMASSYRSSPEELARWEEIGRQALADGKIGLVLLAGGQGTRLGFDHPKGMYDIGLPSHKTIFQIQAERILRVQKQHGRNREIPFYVMTSDATHDETVHFFESSNFFGLRQSQVRFFVQGMLPALYPDGRIIMLSKSKVNFAPNGNGGIYQALAQHGLLDDMQRRGLVGVQVFSVDNVLVRIADPAFVGYVVAENADCAAKVVEKASPSERVGMFVEYDSALLAVEYSELPKHLAESPLFNNGNIAIHWFSLDFLRRAVGWMCSDVKYHVAVKQVDSVDGKVDGIKLESFIFDVFPFATTPRLWQVRRAEEFAPVKNKPGSSADSPDTAGALVLQLHASWAGLDAHEGGLRLEVSPLVSAHGEGLVDNPAERGVLSAVVLRALEKHSLSMSDPPYVYVRSRGLHHGQEHTHLLQQDGGAQVLVIEEY